MRIPQNLRDQKSQLWRLLRNTLIGVVLFLAIDRGLGFVLKQGLDQYFGLNTQDAVLLVGHSHVVLGIDKRRLEKELELPVSKYARAGAQLEDRVLMVRHYAERNPAGPKLIVFGVDGHLFAPRGLSSNAHKLFYPHMNDPLIQEYLQAKALSKKEYLSRRWIHLARYNDVLINVARRGLFHDWRSAVDGKFDAQKLARQAELGDVRPIGLDKTKIAIFEAFLAEAEEKRWPVVLTFVPTTDAWNALEPQIFTQVLRRLQGYADRYDMVQFLDMRAPYDSQHGLFADPIHLNAKGQQLVSDDLAGRLNSILTKQGQ